MYLITSHYCCTKYTHRKAIKHAPIGDNIAKSAMPTSDTVTLHEENINCML